MTRFEGIRHLLQNNKLLKAFEVSNYGNAGGRNKNDFLQIYKVEWMPCKFKSRNLEIHFEIQSDRTFRLDCHWYIYGDYKNFTSKSALLEKCTDLNESLIVERQKFIRDLSKKAQEAYDNKSRLRPVRFNALSGIEWTWDKTCDWKDIADEIADIVTAVTPCIEQFFADKTQTLS